MTTSQLKTATTSVFGRDEFSGRNMELRAAFLSECEHEGIPEDIAEIAQRESRTARKKWWRSGGLSRWLAEVVEVEEKMSALTSSTSKKRKEPERPSSIPPAIASSTLAQEAKCSLLDFIRLSRGDVGNWKFLAAVDLLTSAYRASGQDARTLHDENLCIDGSWMALSRPSFPVCLGLNANGDFMYSLGRMSFDMFRPTELECSIQSIYNQVEVLGGNSQMPASVPWTLQREVQLRTTDEHLDQSSMATLRRNNFVTHLTIEASDNMDCEDSTSTPAPSKPIRAVMTTDGYMLPDPSVPNRFTVWFTGGELAPYHTVDTAQSSSTMQCSLKLSECRRVSKRCPLHGIDRERPSPSMAAWGEIFGQDATWKRTMVERAKVLAAKMFLGAEVPQQMEEDGSMKYALHRPVGGHGSSYVDLLYLDEDLLIVRGNHGSIAVQGRQSNGADGVAMLCEEIDTAGQDANPRKKTRT